MWAQVSAGNGLSLQTSDRRTGAGVSAGDTSVALPLNGSAKLGDVSSSILSSDVDFMSVTQRY